jgi:RNA polymerase sigma factor (sigma-70 family)
MQGHHDVDTESDQELLRRFAAERDNAAFGKLVERHINLTYGTAVRRLGGDSHLAKDVVQDVFTKLAQKSGALASYAALGGWLYTSTCFSAAKAVRSAQRRREHERKAHHMSSAEESSHDEEWARLRPVIDDVLGELKTPERDAIVLRFFQSRSFGEIGAQLNLTENAARMRVDRALEKLREQLARRGIRSTAVALAGVLGAEASLAAPVGLAGAVTAQATAAATGGVVAALFGTTAAKLQVAAAVVLLAAGGAGISVELQTQHKLSRQLGEPSAAKAMADNLRSENRALQAQVLELQSYGNDKQEKERITSELLKVGAKLAAAEDTTASRKSRIAEAPSDTSRLYDIAHLDRPPKVTFQPRPKFPADLRRAGIGGETTATFVVDADGSVKKLAFSKTTHRVLESVVREALLNWKFEPGLAKGTAVKTRMAVPFVFTLNDTNPDWF